MRPSALTFWTIKPDSEPFEVCGGAAELIEESRSSRDSEKKRLERELHSMEKAMREAEDDRYIHHTISSEDFNRVSDRYRSLIKSLRGQLEGLDVDHAEKLQALERILVLAENIGSAYRLADPLMKREYLGLFFTKFFVKDGKVESFELASDVKDLIEEGSVQVTTKGLPR